MEGRSQPFCCTEACCQKQMHDVKINSDQTKRSLEKAKQKKAGEREIEGLKDQYANSLRSLDSEERKHAGCKQRRG